MRYSMEEAYEPNEIELGKGHVFRVRGLTKSVELELVPIQKELDDEFAKPVKGEAFVKALGRYFDIILKRIETPDGGKQSKPSTLLAKAWEKDELDGETAVFLLLAANGALNETGAPPT